MVNFLLIGDKNYNLQLVNSINSLVNNFNLYEKNSTIFIIHKNPKSFIKYLKYIKYQKIEIIKFKKEFKVVNNVKNSHLSEVTYYRLYLDKLIQEKKGYLIYFDADLYFINNCENYLNNAIDELKESNFSIAAVEEKIITKDNIDYFKKLNFESKAYFNAGFIIFNLEKCIDNNLFNNLRIRLSEIDFELKYWDQDILNSVVKGNFLKLSEIINFGVNLNSENNIPKDTLAIHYKGKNKPWNFKFALLEDSKKYQKLNYSNFKSYHITGFGLNITKFIQLKIPIKAKFKIIKIQLLKWI